MKQILNKNISQTQITEDSKIVGDSLQVVSFVMDRGDGKKEDYAVPIEDVKEIRSLEEITKVPNAKSYVKGVMNLRGLIIPVIDIKTKLGFTGNGKVNKEDQRILVLEVENNLYGLLVDGVDQVMKLAVKDIDPPPAGSFEGDQYIKGIAKTDGRLIIFLNVKPLIQDSEVEVPEKSAQQNHTSETPQPGNAEKSESPSQSESNSDAETELPAEIRELFDEEVIPAEHSK